MDEDGDPKNVVSLINKLGTILSRCTEDGNWSPDHPDDAEEFRRLAGKMEAASGKLKQEYVAMDARASFLKNNETQLKTTADALNTQLNEIEQCDPADAITAFSWAQYSYNAALKMGNSILSQSLMDYMR